MSKAFTKETDGELEYPDAADERPLTVKNYMTPLSFRQMEDERRQLLQTERPKVVDVVSWAAGNGDRSENGDYIYGKRRLREIDRRIRFLTKRLESAIVGRSGKADQPLSGVLRGNCHHRLQQRRATNSPNRRHR